ncbi:MAG: glycosyl hydrolase 115 family protein [Saprospiraceae bacterium]|nr:glycosyl hydrolase 115 family protein [Saprospiraceae bacterium]
MKKHLMKKKTSLTSLKLFLILLLSHFVGHSRAQTLLIYGDKADAIEVNAAKDLLADYQKTSKERVALVKFNKDLNLSGYHTLIYIGTASSNSFIYDQIKKGVPPLSGEPLAAETFLLHSIDPHTHLIIGADTRGTFYGVYEFSKKILGTDPNTYWIGYQPKILKKVVIPKLSYRATAPAFQYRGYFDNDNDLLANFKGRKLIVEFDLWKEIINTVVRLGYNYIDIHDLLGRPEYYLRDYYIQLTEFHSDLALIDSVIDYAHSKGMLVQIPMYLGWEFKHITLEQICLTKYYDLWMETYEYYLSQTPIGKADLFLQRPRHPIYDWAYKCEEETSQGIEAGPLMNKMFEGLYQLIQQYRPGGVLFCDLWSEGRPLWESGQFAPRKEIQMLWADGGHANFKEFPQDLKGYPFGVYIHAGVWYNNVTQSPYPAKIKDAALMAIDRHMTSNFLVNGQTFKDFLLNLNACGRCAWDPMSFDPETFYTEWTTKYFGHKVSAPVVEILKLTFDANEPIGGFRNTMNESVKLLNKIAKHEYNLEPLSLINASFTPAAKALELVKAVRPRVPHNKIVSFEDQVAYPTEIFYLNLQFLQSVLLFNNALAQHPDDKAMILQQGTVLKKGLLALRRKLEAGSGWEKWTNFYNPENFRIHTPPPTIEMIEKLISDL